MRIVSYNILDGGEGRADPLAEVIEAQRPDVVGLVEADNLDVLERISRRLDMDYVQAVGGGHAVALLSRRPISESINHGLLKGRPQSLLEGVVEEPGGATWRIGVAHLHPHAFEAEESIREKELEVVLEVFAEARGKGERHLIVGDFNANSPVQQIDFDALKPTSKQAWQAHGGQIPRRVIQTMLGHGYVDVLAAANPGAVGRMVSFTTQFPGQRVDYIFGFGVDASRVKRAWIERDRLAKYASDHFPVCAEIE